MKYAGVKVSGGRVSHKQGSGPVAGVSARVETAGDIDRRITVTRLALAGPFALAMRKKKDNRQTFLTIEGDGFAIVEEVDSKDQKKARKFAADLTAMGRVQQTAPHYGHLPPPPPG